MSVAWWAGLEVPGVGTVKSYRDQQGISCGPRRKRCPRLEFAQRRSPGSVTRRTARRPQEAHGCLVCESELIGHLLARSASEGFSRSPLLAQRAGGQCDKLASRGRKETFVNGRYPGSVTQRGGVGQTSPGVPPTDVSPGGCFRESISHRPSSRLGVKGLRPPTILTATPRRLSGSHPRLVARGGSIV